jgi:hypothetical protein
VDSGLLLVGLRVMSLVVLLMLWQLAEKVRGHVLLLFMVGGGR